MSGAAAAEQALRDAGAARPRDGYRLLPGFLSDDETAAWTEPLDARRELLQQVGTKLGMNLGYHVLSAAAISEHFPALFELARGRLLQVTQAVAGEPLELMRDPRRAVRIQCYRARHEGFRWHLDGGAWSALLTLRNTNRGATEVLSPRWSRRLAYAPYLLFPFPRLFELARPVPLEGRAGDLLILNGGRIVHRGVTRDDGGERLVLVATFNPRGTRPSRVWDTFARWLNY